MVLVAWVRSATAYFFIAVYVLVLGPPALLVTLATNDARLLVALGRWGAMCARHIFGIRVRLEGAERVVGTRPTVYCINHRSNADVIVFELLLPYCRSLKAVYKAELGRLPILGRVLRAAGFVAVERTQRDKAIEAVDAAVERVRNGDSFVLAPEGTRSRTREMLPFKKGAFVLAIKSQAPVVPVAILHSEVALPRGRFYATPCEMVVRVGEPVPTAGLTLDDRDALVATVRADMERLLREAGERRGPSPGDRLG